MIEATTMSDLPEYEQDFAKAILNIVERLHRKHDQNPQEGKICDPVQLANIHFRREHFENNIGIPIVQEIAKMRGKRDEEWKVTTQSRRSEGRRYAT